MEGDAKGQVGGLEMPETERRRLAEESRTWRCPGCGGRTNEAILQEEGGEASEGNQTAAVIPEELKFGFKDEIAKGQNEMKGKGNIPDGASPIHKEEVAAKTSADSDKQLKSSVTANEHVASPAAAGPSAPVPRSQPTSRRPITTAQSNGSPAWLDKAITGVAAALAVMVIKKVALS